ncbi:HNH endonuclease signature motif containing protein [Nocardioides donggukensis]|uniref:DUF222 domain-containing protein n=1 Tax=Nocardioides donggukensis TaxID=2774019 RepID=A0A927K458_9ACTN|nr:HNH endonuclease signature motif containing protein [Nocardioides donggukensis]MBD8870342.1 DUF222 domain-containing protein [Nocardioides donggukensis]
MEHQTGTGTTTEVVSRANAVLGGLDESLWAARSDTDLIGTVEELEALRSHLTAIESSVLAEIEARGTAKHTLAWGSTADWFTHTAGTHRAEGCRTVRQARVLTTERTATHAALTAGTVSPDAARVIVDAVERLPLDPALRARGEAFLLAEAGRLDATELAKAARHLADVVDPDRAGRRAEQELEREDRAAHHGRFLSIAVDGAGGVRVRGRGTVEDAATIKAALLPLTKPAPTTAAETCAEQGDPRDHGARLWDALVEISRHALATDLPPDSHGARPRLAVTTDLDTLTGRLRDRLPVTDDGLELTPATVRRLACDADLIPIVLGTRSEVLDVGRRQRLVTPALWRALVCRDRHCAFPGCTRPPVMGHAHHIVHWSQGGATSLRNLVLLCGHHHRTLHHTPWEVRIRAADGRPEFRPPPKAGHPPRWIRGRPRRE